ncbi:hypothetical protein E3N88_40905 [Mikania micrantha]|uniref:Fatty acid desaturase domain-containing protein n=1 Tax=Mikania micrantha TaxID=192012 RepID=A0A5N6LRA9_9ASTR|nr:hypothetical protein E3N88_40905 [Mikania micrantha]
MMLLSPPITTKFFPKLHHHRHQWPPAHFHSKFMQISHTKTRTTTIKNHRQTHESVNMSSETSGERRLATADAVVDRWREVNWKELDMVTAASVMGLHLLCGFAPFTFSWKALQLAIGLDLGNPIDWVRTHRLHHQYSETERDPHSPNKGFWYSHVLWMFDTDNHANMLGERNIVRDLEKQSFYMFVSRTYVAHPIALALVLYAFGGLPFIVWGMGVRTVWGYHMTWLGNSMAHGLGDQSWDTKDHSLNLGWLGILGYGEGWHNNHHAFEYSARHGLEWWQVDVTWSVIRLLEIIGLASDVKLPSPVDIKRKTFSLNVTSP